ncbi:MAG: hypothetical protein KY476_02210 [Planctomycetes bacterium]|nr:hypothetical protein [Planctomycetota bacterium]
MSLTRIEESLVLAAYFRGGSQDDRAWTSNTDQILTLSLFYTGDISKADCVSRFANRPYIRDLYKNTEWTEEHAWGELTEDIEGRYRALINLLQEHPELIEGGGNFKTPAHPTFTACRLTDIGLKLAATLATQFPKKPDFPNWPDRRTRAESGTA